MKNSLIYFSLPHLLKEYKNNKHIIDAYYAGGSIENFDDSKPGDVEKTDATVLGVTVAVFLFLIVLNIIFYIWAVWILIAKWQFLPTWVRVVSVISLAMGLPIVAILVIYAGAQTDKQQLLGPMDMRYKMCSASR